MVDGTLSLALLLNLGQHGLILPADLVGEAAQSAKVATGLEAEDAQSTRDHHALHRVVRLGDALKDLETLHGGGTARRLVRKHAANGAEKDARGRTVMEGTVGGVGERALAQKLAVLYYTAKDGSIMGNWRHASASFLITLGTEEGARHVELLATDHDDALAREDLLSHDGGQATEEVTLSVNNNNLSHIRWMFRRPWRPSRLDPLYLFKGHSAGAAVAGKRKEGKKTTRATRTKMRNERIWDFSFARSQGGAASIVDRRRARWWKAY